MIIMCVCMCVCLSECEIAWHTFDINVVAAVKLILIWFTLRRKLNKLDCCCYSLPAKVVVVCVNEKLFTLLTGKGNGKGNDNGNSSSNGIYEIYRNSMNIIWFLNCVENCIFTTCELNLIPRNYSKKENDSFDWVFSVGSSKSCNKIIVKIIK